MNVFPKKLGAFNQYFWTRELVAANAIIFWVELDGALGDLSSTTASGTSMASKPSLADALSEVKRLKSRVSQTGAVFHYLKVLTCGLGCAFKLHAPNSKRK